MDIIVCIKRVPDTETRVKVGSDGTHIDRAGVQYIMAPYDEIAVEKAIQMKEASGEGTVTVLTLGPTEATKELRTALAMGADAAVHVVAAESVDALGTAKALRAALEGRTFDLILCGKQATDADDAAVGPMLAALLDLPCVAFIDSLEVADGKARVERDAEGDREILEVTLPAVFTAQKGLAEPRYPGLKGIMAAKKKPLESVEGQSPASATERIALELPPARSEVVLIEGDEAGMKRLLTALREEKKVL